MQYIIKSHDGKTYWKNEWFLNGTTVHIRLFCASNSVKDD